MTMQTDPELAKLAATLSEALVLAWAEATRMRNAAKLVGPYPNDQAKNAIWQRSLYHEGKRLHEILKPYRQALRNHLTKETPRAE